MNREEYLRGEIGFLSELLEQVTEAYPKTKKFIDKALERRMEKNAKLKKKFENPDFALQNLGEEVDRLLLGDDR